MLTLAVKAGWVPVIDDALQQLDEPDRDAIVLRFFQNASLRTVGTALGVSEDAAQKRVARALDRLRDGLQRRGLTCPTGALAVALAAGTGPLAPTGLVLGTGVRGAPPPDGFAEKKAAARRLIRAAVEKERSAAPARSE